MSDGPIKLGKKLDYVYVWTMEPRVSNLDLRQLLAIEVKKLGGNALETTSLNLEGDGFRFFQFYSRHASGAAVKATSR